MWDIYQSDIFNTGLNIQDIDIENISNNLREYKRIFGEPPIPTKIPAPNAEREKLLTLINKMYLREYYKLNYKNEKLVVEVNEDQ